MKIRFSPRVLEEERFFPIFDVIMLFVEDRRHGIDPDQVRMILGSAWVRARGRDLGDFIRAAIATRAKDRFVDKVAVMIDGACRRNGVVDFEKLETCLHPLDVIPFLSMPFHLIVENEWYDGAFLLWMSKALDFTRLIEAERRGAFVFRHAGGKDALPRCAELLSKGVWPRRDGAHQRPMRLRAAALLDSDRRHMGHEPNARLVSEILPHVAFVHQLRRRSIESYLPAEFVRQWAGRRNNFRQSADALDRLTEDQRSCYGMKSGFRYRHDEEPEKNRYMASAEISPEEKALFGSLPDEIWEYLMNGFGTGLSQIFTEEGSRPNPRDHRLSNQSDRHELLELIHEIYGRL